MWKLSTKKSNSKTKKNFVAIKNMRSQLLIFKNQKDINVRFLNLKFKNYKNLWKAIKNVKSEIYILKIINMVIQGAHS